MIQVLCSYGLMKVNTGYFDSKQKLHVQEIVNHVNIYIYVVKQVTYYF